MEAFGIWRSRTDARVSALEQAVQELRRHLAHLVDGYRPPRRGERRYLALLDDHLGNEDVRCLAFELGIDYDVLPGESKRGRLLSLVVEMERQGRLYQLEQKACEMRPNVEWPPFM